MKLDIIKVRVSIDHLTLTSDDRSLITFDPSVLGHYHHLPRIPIKKHEHEEHMSRTYEDFHQFRHKNTGNKVHIFTDRFNTESFKTLFAPNITAKFFSSWEHPLTYEEVVGVHNRLTEKYNVYFWIAEFHVAVDLFFAGDGENPIHRLVGQTLSGRKMDPEPHPKYPNTWLFHTGSGRFCLIIYDKGGQLFDKKINELSIQSLGELGAYHVVRLESRFKNRILKVVQSLEELATQDFSFIYPQHIKFLWPDRDKLVKHGIHPKDYRGLSLSKLRKHMIKENIANNFSYYLRNHDQLSEPVVAALKNFRWEKNPEKYPIWLPDFKIRPQKIQFIKH